MQLEMILPDRAYAFFSHTHKAQKENMPLLDKVLHFLLVPTSSFPFRLIYIYIYFYVFLCMKILAERVSLYDYELIVGDNGKRLLAFGKFAGRAGLIDFLHGLGLSMFYFYCTKFISYGFFSSQIISL